MKDHYFRVVKRGLIVLFLFINQWVGAQILDDSTKLIYGPTTTQYIYEHNIKYNDLYFNYVDTAVFNLHRFTPTEVSQYLLQDLGVIGTATRSIYYNPPELIGARSGFTAYEPYFKPPEDFKYYDTKSPYSRIGAAIGGNGRSSVDVGFNRSDSSNFNIGIDYFRKVGDKQTASLGRNDRLTDSEGYDIYFLYYTPNRKYLALTNFTRNKNTVVDQGGIDTTDVEDGYFDENAKVYLENARSEYLRRNYHFYHQFNPDSIFQLYQSYDYSYASSKFRNDNLSTDTAYFDQFNFSRDTTSEENNFITQTLETGFKGTIGKLFFLGYYKIRSFDFQYGKRDSDTLNFRLEKPDTYGIEHYVGGAARIQLNRKYRLSGTIDFNLNGNQRLTGDLLAKNFDVRFLLQQHSPSFMDQAYLGNHDYWINNDLKNIKTLDLEGGYVQRVGRSYIRPKARFSTHTDYIYYDTTAVPVQINGTATILSPGVDFGINFFNRIHLAGNVDYNIVSGNTTEAFPLPELLVNLNIYYHNIFFNNNLELQVGIDNHWKSDYYAPNYQVSSHQFFIQDDFNIPSYLISDIYMNVKLDHAFLFAKLNNWLQLFNGEGYFVAPKYIGKRTLFDFGFYWMFYD